MSLRLLITGATGQIGWQLQRTLAPLGEVIACTRAQVDLADPEAAAQSVRELAPDIVVNAAAYTAVDKAESEPDLAHTVNAVAPGRIAEELARTGGLLIHYSTDYVFDGAKTSPYEEGDPTGPLNVYGRTKLAGEQLIAASGCAHIILRTIVGLRYPRQELSADRVAPGTRKGRAAHGRRPTRRSDMGPCYRRGHRADRRPVRTAARFVRMGLRRDLSPYGRRPDDMGWFR